MMLGCFQAVGYTEVLAITVLLPTENLGVAQYAHRLCPAQDRRQAQVSQRMFGANLIGKSTFPFLRLWLQQATNIAVRLSRGSAYRGRK